MKDMANFVGFCKGSSKQPKKNSKLVKQSPVRSKNNGKNHVWNTNVC